jgi:hypothetical protein
MRMDAEDRAERITATQLLARRLLDGGELGDVAKQVRTLWDFDQLIYRGGIPARLDEFVAMCWWQASDVFEESGGRDRLIRAAEVAAATP